MSDYEKQANDFLESVGATMECTFKYHGKYFKGEKDTRDVWKVAFKREHGTLTLKFGQSIVDTGTPPTSYDVLACVTKSDPGTFEEFCDEFGYDNDPAGTYRTYEAVKAEWLNVTEFFSEEELERLREIR